MTNLSKTEKQTIIIKTKIMETIEKSKTEIVYRGEDGQAITNSLIVAEKFEKNHQHILRDIRLLIERISNIGPVQMFAETTYIHEQNGQEYPMYLMNRDGFTLLTMGFTGEKALKFKLDYIAAFNTMEKMLKEESKAVPTTFREALLLAAEQQRQIEEQQARLEAEKPKVLFADAVSTSKRSCLIAELAKLLQQNGVKIGQNRLFEWMRKHGYLCTRGEYKNQPTQKSMEMGLFELKKTTITKPDGTVLVSNTTKVTGRGQIYFINKFLNDEAGKVA